MTTKTQAYDLHVQSTPFDPLKTEHMGWVFGLPRGITPQQWPLDPQSGWPLAHAFTLKLPKDHQKQGAGIVAVAFFATPAEHNDGGIDVDEDMSNAVKGKGNKPTDPVLSNLWEHAQHAHPKLWRMTDVLDYEYAAIWLTQKEFEGDPCLPPEPVENLETVSAQTKPQWLDRGTAHAFLFESKNTENTNCFWSHNARPEARLDWNLAVISTVRTTDLNAGKIPAEVYDDEVGPDGYQSEWNFSKDDDEALKLWAHGFAPNHIGGTMRPAQAILEFTPHYVEFEEDFGGFNFGGGNAQLDLANPLFDWACG